MRTRSIFSMRHDGIRIDFHANGGLRVVLRKIQLNTTLPKRTLHRHDPNRTLNTGGYSGPFFI